jgi:purine nucleosidase
MKKYIPIAATLFLLATLCQCKPKDPTVKEAKAEVPEAPQKKIKLIFDTDANNELDDQHALAYMLLNGNTFDVKGITVNATYNGAGIQGHYDEAERIMQLCNLKGAVPLLKGAEKNFDAIAQTFDPMAFDGQEAVDFLLESTKTDTLVIVAVGKLTNVALALKKDPSFAERTKVVWLGSNYPEPGEYNQDNDTIAMNYVLNRTLPFEMVTVRYGKPSGTDAVSLTKTEVNDMMPGLGPTATVPIVGRHGGTFSTFGDYSINLFEHIFDHIDHEGSTQSRPLFDMVALAILKNPDWGSTMVIPAPILINNQWVERPQNQRSITLWENFEKDPILADFHETLRKPVPITAQPSP